MSNWEHCYLSDLCYLKLSKGSMEGCRFKDVIFKAMSKTYSYHYFGCSSSYLSFPVAEEKVKRLIGV